MKNIAILEDEDGAAELLISYIEKYSAVTGQKFEIMSLSPRWNFLRTISPFTP